MEVRKSPAKALAPLLKGPLWYLMEEYLSAEKERLVLILLNCNESELKKTQGAISTLDNISKLHSQLKTEERS